MEGAKSLHGCGAIRKLPCRHHLEGNAEEWKRLAVEAGREGGSCDKNMEAFVDEIMFSKADEVKDKDDCSKGI
ncbi:hypothetical protein DY000_02044475 [Brassica cretica]|uniref:Uncharacterized protein n=1 Tax=Brassica cretica TaxID=69181 RepID=A0ABQ7ETC2_BRACR|nr:hypothetical protein DY000_02044475 [Brassica cretica]